MNRNKYNEYKTITQQVNLNTLEERRLSMTLKFEKDCKNQLRHPFPEIIQEIQTFPFSNTNTN